MWPAISKHISETTSRPFDCENTVPMGGGCINETVRIEGGGQVFFVKLNRASLLEMFEAEADGLRDLRAANAIRVPEPLCCGVAGDRAYLVLEYIKMGGRGDDAEMGRQLAALHRRTSEKFGWHRDNTIGITPQLNTPEDKNWISFYRDKRLKYQFDLAARNGRVFSGADDLLKSIDRFFENYAPKPSLLHGDLWGGNASFDHSGNPLIYDPAVYYGDREAELASTEMFGGFGRGFYQAYETAWPLDSGYSMRKPLYNLYHVLNHYNLFGGGYGEQAEGMVKHLAFEI